MLFLLFFLLILLLLQQATGNAQLVGVSKATICTTGGHYQKFSNYIQARDHMLEGIFDRTVTQTLYAKGINLYHRVS